MNAFACSLALSAGIAFTGAPAPTERVETVMQDDAALLYRSPAQVRRNLRRMARLGVDRVRITASWRQLAPDRDARRKPAFDATDPGAYDRAALKRLDDAVDGARARGIAGNRVALVVVGVVDLLAVHGHGAVLVVADVGLTEVLRGPVLVAAVALRAAERLVLGVAVGPVLQVLGRIVLQLRHFLLGSFLFLLQLALLFLLVGHRFLPV